MTGMILGLVACYLICSVVGALIFIGIGSHVCSKDREFHEFIADVNAAHERGEL